jgi:hypothetical protein
MKRKSLFVLFVLTWLVFGIAWYGKQHFPRYLGVPWVQYSAAILTALGCPLGALFALRLMHTGDRQNGYWLLLGFCAPVAATLAIEGIAAPWVGRSYADMKPTRNEFGAIDRASQYCLTPDMDAAQRAQRAAFAYTTWGIKLAVLNKSSSITLFVPDRQDEANLAKTVQSWRVSDRMEKLLDDQLQQMPWICVLYLGGFCLVFAVGLGWFAYGGRRAADSSNSSKAIST